MPCLHHRLVVASLAICWLGLVSVPAVSGEKLSISGVTPSSSSFNPSQREQVKVAYQLSRDAAVTVKVFDADFELVRILADKAQRKAGDHSEAWDGRDLDGKIVPNEAYFFTIEAEDPSSGETSVYDPTTFSGGEAFDIGAAKFDRASGTLTYRLPQPARVLIRLGITQGGPLLRTLVDWEPRISGEITELWNGKDADNVLEIWGLPKFRTLITGFTLPATSVITIGNTREEYRTYKLSLAQGRPKKLDRQWTAPRPPKRSRHFALPRLWDHAPQVLISFPQLDPAQASEAVPALKDKVVVRLDITGTNRDFIRNQQFEFIFFTDNVFFAEKEKAYVPYNFLWEVSQLPAGEHILTVNLVTSKGQIGVVSRKIKVMR